MAAVVDLRASLSKVESRVGTKDQEGLLGEIQTELRALPTRLDDYLGGPSFPGIRRGRFHPMMFRELLHMAPHMSPHSPAFGVLMLASFFRDSMPWLYELGMEVYRAAKQGDAAYLQQAAREFRQAVEFAAHGPFQREFFGWSKDTLMMMEEIEPLLDRALSMLGVETRPGRRRQKKASSEDA